MIRNLTLFLVAVFWLSIAFWVFKDARRRIEDPWLVGMATLLGLVPFVGPIIYMLFRPPEYLEDVRERELEMAAAEARLHHLGYQLCPHCDHEVEREFLRCPACMRKLRDPCGSCGRPLEPTWKVCPYCEAEIPGVTPQPRRRRPRPAATELPPVGGAPPRGAAGP